MSVVDLSWPLEHVAQLTVDNGPYNFSDWTLQENLERGLTEAREEGARVVVIASAVEGYFIAHGSIADLLDTFVNGKQSGDPMAALRVQKELESGPMVSIAAIEGQAWGGGAELAFACDLRVVSESATFALHEVRVGTHPAGGVTRVRHLAGEAVLRQLLLDGRPVSGAEAHRLHLAHRLTLPGEALATAVEWARWLVTHPPDALATSKAIINQTREAGYRDGLRLETTRFVERFQDPGFVEGLRRVEARYDEGADSYEAFGIERT